MSSGPFDVELDSERRRDLAWHLRDLLERGPLDVGTIAAHLGVEPEVVVVALRELRVGHPGRLRSAICLGHVSWWWEPEDRPPAPAGEALSPAEDESGADGGPPHKRRHKGKHKKG
jgi:hypothetical protein